MFRLLLSHLQALKDTDPKQGHILHCGISDAYIYLVYSVGVCMHTAYQIYVRATCFDPFKLSSGPLRYRSKTKSYSALWDPRRLHISSIHCACIPPHCVLDICKRWVSHNALDDLLLDLYLRGPEDDLTRVETCSFRFMYIYAINKLLCQTDRNLIFVLLRLLGSRQKFISIYISIGHHRMFR